MAETRVALVTGGDTGIGKAIADALRADGCEVRSASRRTGCDLLDRDAIARLVGALPRLDVLVNNAGIAESAPLQKTTDEQWDRHLALNATAPFLLCRAALPLLRRSNGCIINIASTAARRGDPYIAAYTASKHALLGLSRVLAAELKDKVRVHAVCPGFVDTPLTDRSVEHVVAMTGMGAEEARAALAKQNASGRLVQPEAVAEAVVKLSHADATGTELVLE